MDKEKINIIELGTTYELPKWKVETNEGIVQTGDVLKIDFVRGDKRPEITEEEYEKVHARLQTLILYDGIKSKYIKINRRNTTELTKDQIEIYQTEIDELDIIFNRFNDPVKRVDGVLHEQILNMSIIDLSYKNDLFPSKETSKAIEKLKEALFWLQERSKDRTNRDVIGKYEK